MSCSAVRIELKRPQKNLNGVQFASVNFATEKLTIKIDADLVVMDRLSQLLKRLDFS